MRSALLLGLVLLAGCKPAEQAPAKPDENDLVLTVTASDIPPTDQVAPPPTVPGERKKQPKVPGADALVRGKRYQALGTEPFWSLEVLPGKLIYTSPEVQPGIAVTYTLTGQGKQLRYSGTLQGKPMVLTIEPGECSDGMSDTVYPYKASFTWGDRTEQGCARAK